MGASFGRGAATTAQWDLANSDCILIMGSNMAECHPEAFRFVMEARRRGATAIHVDPRYTRTSAMSDVHVPIRAGTDIAFLGGLINYVLENDLWFKDYVINYTNASHLIREDFQDSEDLEGVFSGLEREQRIYRYGSWQYRGQPVPPATAEHHIQNAEPHSQHLGRLAGPVKETDPTLQDPKCVFQILKRHYSRYTPEMVQEICGCPKEQFLKVAQALTQNSGRERTGAVCYAVGWTQHTVGTQMIRAASVLQLLLGNIGRPGGGILALRGHASIQGSTDIPTLYNMLPGYLAMPDVIQPHGSLKEYLEAETPGTGWWNNLPKYMVSLLKAWYGEAATPENGFAYGNLPHLDGDYSQEPMMLDIHDGKIKGFLVIGQNPAVGGHNAGLVRRGLAQLDWMVVRDAFETETASFWYASPEVKSGELEPHQIKTEIFFLPAALPGEKDGSFTNTQRLIQWHDKAVEPPGDARSEAWFMFHLGRRLRELYRDSTEPRDRPLLDLTWDYPTRGPLENPDAEYILREINGYTWAPRWEDRHLAKGFTELKDDGSTACGCWIYTGVYPEEGKNLARNRTPDPDGNPGSHLGWGFSWPANRRIIYNRCSADPEGRPWSERKRYIWWDGERKHWVGYDVPDFTADKAPDYAPPPDAVGMASHSGTSPFIMMADGKGWLYAAAGLKDGPLPTHYEPVESPVVNRLYPNQQFNPVAGLFMRPDNPYHAAGDPAFPCVITTYRLAEHHTGGTMTRWLPWLAELQPNGFVEISRELAAEKGIKTGDWVTLSTLRGEVEARALVTGRLKPLNLDGKVIHQIGMPWHFGYKGTANGDIANTLSSIVQDPNSQIHEGKVFTCNLRPGRKEKR